MHGAVPHEESSLAAGYTTYRIVLQTFDGGLDPSPWCCSIQKVPLLVLDEFSLDCYKERYHSSE
jgi:hypothetical protein